MNPADRQMVINFLDKLQGILAEIPEGVLVASIYAHVNDLIDRPTFVNMCAALVLTGRARLENDRIFAQRLN